MKQKIITFELISLAEHDFKKGYGKGTIFYVDKVLTEIQLIILKSTARSFYPSLSINVPF